MRVFVQISQTLKRELDVGVKIYLPKLFENTIFKSWFISNYFGTRSSLARAEKYLDESRFGKQYFPTLG